jgi:hypothetical protein
LALSGPLYGPACGTNKYITLNDLATESVKHDKPIVFPEWADEFSDGYCLTQFVNWMSNHNVVAHAYWNDSSGNLNTYLPEYPARQQAFNAVFANTSYAGDYWRYTGSYWTH